MRNLTGDQNKNHIFKNHAEPAKNVSFPRRYDR